MRRQRIYIAGPYRPTDKQRQGTLTKREAIAANIDRAKERAIVIHKLGHFAYCPHTHTADFDVYASDIPDMHWLALGLDMLKHCEALALVEGWEQSKGTHYELQYADFANMHIYQTDELPEVVNAS